MELQQAQDLVKQLLPTLKQWVCDHCGEDKRLIPLALLYVHQRLSEQDWQLVLQYDGKQTFEAFIRELAEEALEAFSYGVWFGKCSQDINFWLTRYGIKNEGRRQDAEDYIKNKLTENQFARFKSYKKDKKTHFATYISRVVRNLLIDFLRKKTPETETLETIERDDDFTKRTMTNSNVEAQKQQHLEGISQWFFADSASQKADEPAARSPDLPDTIKLSPKERLFLRAIYKDKLSVTAAGSLPGINMNKLQAYEYHRRLKKRIKKLLHAMGYENLQSLLNPN